MSRKLKKNHLYSVMKKRMLIIFVRPRYKNRTIFNAYEGLMACNFISENDSNPALNRKQDCRQ
jgi:hypothetical protein